MIKSKNGKIGNITLQFGKDENERYIVATTKIKVFTLIINLHTNHINSY